MSDFKPDINLHIEAEAGSKTKPDVKKSNELTEFLTKALARMSEKPGALDRTSDNLTSTISNIEAANAQAAESLGNKTFAVKVAAWKAKRGVRNVWNSFKTAVGF